MVLTLFSGANDCSATCWVLVTSTEEPSVFLISACTEATLETVSTVTVALVTSPGAPAKVWTVASGMSTPALAKVLPAS